MQAAVIHSFDGIEKISLEEVEIPEPQDQEVQVKISYAGVNPVDWKIAEGLLSTRLDYQFPIILGWDAAGVVSAVGKKVTHLKEGDPVYAYCRKEMLRDGSFAEYICLDAENVVIKPKTLSFAEAAAIPLSALTAWQSLYDTAHLNQKDKVLIHAGAGGVGGYAIQLARIAGAYVLTTASTSNFDYVTNLGADETIDYTKESFADYIHKHYPEGIDVVFDTVGDTTLKASYAITKEGGRLISIAGVLDQALANQRHLMAEFVFVKPDGKQLQKIAQLIDDGKIQPPRIQEIPFQEAVAALRKSREGHVQGKLVLKIL